MLDYTHNFNKDSTVILNIAGKIIIDNVLNNTLRLEVDYNSFSKEVLDKIKKGKEDLFKKYTDCITYNANKELEKCIYIPYYSNQKLYWYKALSENNSINFSMIKNIVEIYKNNILIETKDIGYSKKINFSLNDGTYIFRIKTYTTEDEEINSNDIEVILKTNYYSFNDKQANNIEIIFDENEGNFKLILAANSKKLYSFKIVDIISENDSIFDFSYYNSIDNKEVIKGKIGSDIQLLNDKQIEEIIKYPEQEQLIKPEFVFDIKELLSDKKSQNDIGIVKIPTIRSKLKDTYSKYYDLKCDVSQNYAIDLNKTNDFLITDKFISEPLFYKFIIDKPFEKIELIDNNNNSIEYSIEKISNDIHIVYFNPLRNKEYFLKIDDYIEYVNYKKSYESFKSIYTKPIKSETSIYFGDLMIKGTDIYEVTITFEDYQKKTFTIKGTDKECNYLEDERIKINNRILSLEINKEFSEIINMICPLKNNRTNYSYFKNNNQDFVYIAKEVQNFKLEDIPSSEINKVKLDKRYILKNNELLEVPNGVIYLEDINKTDITFTDIETWTKENAIGNKQILRTGIKDEYFKDNIVDSTMEVVYENK